MGKLNLETVKKQGLRVTPYDQIPVIAGALAGTANISFCKAKRSKMVSML